MSKGISKKQLALAIAKGKRIELILLEANYVKRWKLHASRQGMDVNKPPKTIYSNMIADRVKELDREILEIDNYVPVAVEGKGLIQ